MPPKRRAATGETSASGPASKRTRLTANEDATPTRRSPRKSRDTRAEAAAVETSRAKSNEEGKSPRRKSTGKKIELKSWLSNGTSQDEKAIDKAAQAAADAAEEEAPQVDENENGEEVRDGEEEEEPGEPVKKQEAAEPEPIRRRLRKEGSRRKKLPRRLQPRRTLQWRTRL